MKKIMMIILISLWILTGCTEENNTTQGLTLQMIEVQLITDPLRIMPNDPVKIMATVTLEGEEVENADEVLFEIWEDGNEELSEKIEGKHEGKGVYSISKTFEETGVYYVISHVSLREMHNMPKLKLVIGDVPGEDQIHEQEEHDHEMEHEESDNYGHNH